MVSGPTQNLVSKQSVPMQLGAIVPSVYQKVAPSPSRKDGVCISACEGAQATVTTAAAATFGLSSNVLSPTNNGIFPWLFTQAQQWTKFYFRRLRLVFVSNQASTTNFTVWMAFSPDVEVDTNFSGIIDVMAMAQRNMATAWQSFDLTCNMPEEGAEPFYIDADGADDRLENQGIVFLGQSGQTGDATAKIYGQWFVEYTVDLYDRKPTNITMLGLQMEKALFNRSLPRELRIKAGMAFVEEVIRSRPTRGEKERPEVVLRRKVEALLGPTASMSTSRLSGLPPCT